MCKLRIIGKFYNMAIISVYVPTEDENKGNAENVERFYNKFSDVCDQTPRNEALILLGDFNVKTGKGHSNTRVAGRHTLHDITSENGEKIVELAIAHNLEISSTKFQQRRIHKGTWKFPGQDICNQIDHILINKRRASTRSANKAMRLIQYNSVLTFKLQIEFVPFKIVPLGRYTPPETLFPIFVATLVVANRNRFWLVGYSFFDVFHRPKMASFKVKL